MKSFIGLVVASLLAASMALPVTADEAWPTCGELDIVLRNPDLQPQSDGAMRASGQYFFHFQVIGENADKVDAVAMSLGPETGDYGEDACDQPVWFTGPYLMNFRADRNAADGFFLPAQTQDLPDGIFAGALHAYDAQGNEIGRSWGRALIDNCDGPEGSTCDDDPEQMLRHDKGLPWPMILPGDGAVDPGRALSIEFAEAISNLTVLLNGVDISDDMEEWEGRQWDDDVIPDSSPNGGPGPTGEPCTHAAHTCIKLGPAFQWDVRALEPSDVLHIEATDLAGNVAIRDLHVGAGINSGLLLAEGPVLDISVDSPARTAAPGAASVFRFSMSNTGNGDAHPFADHVVPEGWTGEWLTHEAVPRGTIGKQEFTVTSPLDTPPGSYTLGAQISWPVPGGTEERTWDLTVNVTGKPILDKDPAQPVQEAEGKDSPSPPAFITAGILVASLALLRRRMPPAHS